MSSSTMITISVPLRRADRQQAQTFKDLQPIAEKAEQVYENTLAVLATHHYLDMIDIPTDLENSYSQNPIAFLSTNVADLYVPEARGRLECRVVRAGEETCFIPEEVWSDGNQGDRIGYVVVQLNETNTEAIVLGFVPEVSVERLPLSYLRSLDDLIETIYAPVLSPLPVLANTFVQLQQWLENQVEKIWQPTETLPQSGCFARGEDETAQLINQFLVSQSDPETIELIEQSDFELETKLMQIIDGTQNEVTLFEAIKLLQAINPNHPAIGIQKAKDLGMYLNEQSVALMVAVVARPEGRVAIFLRVYPIRNQRFLPAGLMMTLLDEAGNIVHEVQAETQDYECIELKFGVDQGTCFSVRILVEDASVTESFIA